MNIENCVVENIYYLLKMQFNIGNKIIGSNQCFIIAEIGQNHQGDINIAKQMILSAKVSNTIGTKIIFYLLSFPYQNCGVDCVKFQKSSLPDKFTAAALQRQYTNCNSWGTTYGAHKTYLEFSLEQFRELQRYANDNDILFTASAMDITSLHQLYSINVPFIKIGSGDTDNFPLIQIAAQNQTPLIISTGMQHEKTIEKVIEIMHTNGKENYCLLHCVSSYPTVPEFCHLRMIEHYRSKYGRHCIIGYSGHETGTSISLAAYCLGAGVIERHFTLDKKQKGTDHQLSLMPHEMKLLVDNIRCLEENRKNDPALCEFTESTNVFEKLKKFPLSTNDLNEISAALKPIENVKEILACEMDCHRKLGKSLVYTKSMKCGQQLEYNDICCKVTEPKGIPASKFFDILGMKLNENVVEENIVSMNQLI